MRRPPSYRSRPKRASSCRSEEHTSELQSRLHLVCRLLLEKKKEELPAGSSNRRATRVASHATLTSRAVMQTYAACMYGIDTRAPLVCFGLVFFFFNHTAPPEIYPLSLHDALPISQGFDQGDVEFARHDRGRHQAAARS